MKIRNILIITLAPVIIGVQMVGCSIENAEAKEHYEQIEIKSECKISAYEFYDNAPFSVMSESIKAKKAKMDGLLRKVSEDTIIETTTEASEKGEEKLIETTEYIMSDYDMPQVVEETTQAAIEDYDGRYCESYSNNGTLIHWAVVHSEPQLVLANGDVNGKERTSSIAARIGARYAINGGMWYTGSGMACGLTGIGDTIYQALDDKEKGDTLILRQNGLLDSVYMTEDEYSQICPKWAVKGCVPVINNGVRTEYKHERHPRTFIGQDWNGTYYIGVSGGRGVNGVGLTYDELYDFAVVQMCTNLRFLYVLDGGGSSTMVCDGKIVNTPTDGAERSVVNSIVFY